jgi:hypothetical protein
LRRFLLHTIIFLVFPFFIRCNTRSIDKKFEEKAVRLASNIDETSIKMLKKYCFGKRGELEFWQRVSEDSFLYSFSQNIKGDTIELSVFRPFNFIKDFTTNYHFDTSLYYEFRFSKLKDSIVKFVALDHYSQEKISNISISLKQIFSGQDPFVTVSTLAAIKDKFDFIGTSYRSDIGDFIEFWLSAQFKLTYLPDTSIMNPKYKKYWLDDFSKGKQIQNHWSLQKVYDR